MREEEEKGHPNHSNDGIFCIDLIPRTCGKPEKNAHTPHHVSHSQWVGAFTYIHTLVMIDRPAILLIFLIVFSFVCFVFAWGMQAEWVHDIQIL